MRSIRLFIVLIFCFLSLHHVSGKEFSLNWYEGKSNVQGLNKDFKILKANSNYIYYLSEPDIEFGSANLTNPFARINFHIVKYNLKANTDSVCEINFNYKDEDLSYFDAIPMGDTLVVFSYNWHSKTKLYNLFCETYDLNSMKSNNDMKKISDIDLSDIDVPHIWIKQNDIIWDKGRFLFRYIWSSKEGDFWGFQVLNDQRLVEWENPLLPFSGGEYLNEMDYGVDYEGNVYSVLRTFESKTEMYDQHIEYGTVKINFYHRLGAQAPTIQLALKNAKVINNIKCSVNKKNELICTGVYSSRESDLVTGCFSFNVDLYGSKIKSNFQTEFSDEFKNKGTTEREYLEVFKSYDEVGTLGFSCDSIHFKSDESFNVVFQRYSHIVQVVIGNGRTYARSERIYGDNYVLAFNADGSPKWQQKIAKNTILFKSKYHIGNYLCWYDEKESMNFLFNINNLSGKKSKSEKATKTIFIGLDKDGNESFKLIEGDWKIASELCVQNAFVRDDKTIVLLKYSSVNKSQRFTLSNKNNFLEFGELIIR